MSELPTPPKEDELRSSDSEDYYFEGTAMVFTARFHLRRGYCCDNGCRHCPYKQNQNAELLLEQATQSLRIRR
jgi:hypothetical protein